MEAIVIIIAQLLALALAPIAAIFAGISSVFGAIVIALLRAVFGTAIQIPGVARVGRKVLLVMAGLGLIAAMVVVVLDTFFFQPTLRFALDKVAARTGYHVNYTSAEGSLIGGRLSLSGVEVLREADTGLNIDASVERLEFELSVVSLISPTVEMERLLVQGVQGDLFLHSPGSSGRDPNPPPRRKFVVARAEIRDVAANVHTGATSYSVEIDEGVVEPFRSRLALFDLLFRSNMNARFDGATLLVKTEQIAERGRRTEWVIEDMPIDLAGRIVRQPPLTWLNDGQLSARVFDEWELGDTRINMDWNVSLENVTVAAPQGAGGVQRLAIAALNKVVAANDGNAEFAFALSLEDGDLSTWTNGDMAVFWKTLQDSFLEKLTFGQGDGGGSRLEGAADRMREILRRDEN